MKTERDLSFDFLPKSGSPLLFRSVMSPAGTRGNIPTKTKPDSMRHLNVKSEAIIVLNDKEGYSISLLFKIKFNNGFSVSALRKIFPKSKITRMLYSILYFITYAFPFILFFYFIYVVIWKRKKQVWSLLGFHIPFDELDIAIRKWQKKFFDRKLLHRDEFLSISGLEIIFKSTFLKKMFVFSDGGTVSSYHHYRRRHHCGF